MLLLKTYRQHLNFSNTFRTISFYSRAKLSLPSACINFALTLNDAAQKFPHEADDAGEMRRFNSSAVHGGWSGLVWCLSIQCHLALRSCQARWVKYSFYIWGLEVPCKVLFTSKQSEKVFQCGHITTLENSKAPGIIFFFLIWIYICFYSHNPFLLMKINTCWKPLANEKFTNRILNAPSLMKCN